MSTSRLLALLTICLLMIGEFLILWLLRVYSKAIESAVSKNSRTGFMKTMRCKRASLLCGFFAVSRNSKLIIFKLRCQTYKLLFCASFCYPCSFLEIPALHTSPIHLLNHHTSQIVFHQNTFRLLWCAVDSNNNFSVPHLSSEKGSALACLQMRFFQALLFCWTWNIYHNLATCIL